MVCLLSLSTLCMAQIKISSPPSEKQLVANETWIVASGRGSFRVITSNDSIAHAFMGRVEQQMSKFTYIQKKDRHGYYWERCFYFKNEYWDSVVLFINNKFR